MSFYRLVVRLQRDQSLTVLRTQLVLLFSIGKLRLSTHLNPPPSVCPFLCVPNICTSSPQNVTVGFGVSPPVTAKSRVFLRQPLILPSLVSSIYRKNSVNIGLYSGSGLRPPVGQGLSVPKLCMRVLRVCWSLGTQNGG